MCSSKLNFQITCNTIQEVLLIKLKGYTQKRKASSSLVLFSALLTARPILTLAGTSKTKLTALPAFAGLSPRPIPPREPAQSGREISLHNVPNKETLQNVRSLTVNL